MQRPEKKAEKKAQGKSLVSEHHEMWWQENHQIHSLEEDMAVLAHNNRTMITRAHNKRTMITIAHNKRTQKTSALD